MYAMYNGIKYDGVAVTKVDDDGRFTVTGPHNLLIGDCNPAHVLLYGDNDNQVQPEVKAPEQSVDPGMLAAFQILFGGGFDG